MTNRNGEQCECEYCDDPPFTWLIVRRENVTPAWPKYIGYCKKHKYKIEELTKKGFYKKITYNDYCILKVIDE